MQNMSKAKHLVFIFLVGLCACKQAGRKKHSINPEAKKLADSAVYIGIHQQDYATAIYLLNQAVEIDSNYTGAYLSKFAFQGLMKPNDQDKMLETLQKIIHLLPEAPDYYLYAGLIYIKKGDTILSKQYLQDAIVHYDKFLDTMKKSNIAHGILLMSKGFSLILIGDEEKGHAILKEAYDQETDTSLKKKFYAAVKKSRKEILDTLSFDK